MMMRQIATYLLAALTYMVFVSANPVFGAVADHVKLISQYHSNHMTFNDLAFFLATHNFNATQKDGYVQITYNGTPCKATLNNETGYVELMFN